MPKSIFSTNQFVLLATFLLLIVAKLAHIWHIQLPAIHAYFDADRALALGGFLLAYLYVKQPSTESLRRSAVIFLGGFSLLVATPLVAPLGLQDPAGFAEKMAILYVMTALVEEILFRGFLAEWMARKWGAVVGGIGSSLVFTLLHPGAYIYPIYGLMVFLTGLLCFVLYWSFRRRFGVPEGVALATFGHAAIIFLGMYLGIL